MKSKTLDKIANNVILAMRRDRESEMIEKEDMFKHAFKDKESSQEVIKLINTILKHSQNYEITVSAQRLSISSNVERKVGKRKGASQTMPVGSMTKPGYDEDINIPVTIEIYKDKGFTLSIRYGYDIFKDKKLFNLFVDQFNELHKIRIRNNFKTSIDSLISSSNLKRGSVLDELLVD
jgi:hypothetical protein